MRLIHVFTLEFHEFPSAKEAPPYIVASHRWLDHEISYQEFLRCKSATSIAGDEAALKKLEKMRYFCEYVRRWQADLVARHKMKTNLDQPPQLPCYLWIDTACINKESSAELQEAIASMFEWYERAWCCFAYLHDVGSPMLCSPLAIMDQLKRSVWMTRGWTLQELLAPKYVMFFSQDWQVLGHKSHHQPLNTPDGYTINAADINMPLNAIVAECTGIREDILWDMSKLKQTSMEDRLAWMNGRTTTRIEDRAYCMLGICRVFIPLIYGSGEDALNKFRKEIREVHGVDISDEALKVGRRVAGAIRAESQQKKTHRPKPQKNVRISPLSAWFAGGPTS